MANAKHDLYIGNTDHDWFDFCKSHPNLEEVNFWQPSAKKFRIVDEGAIFFFRRKAPINLIGGFGILASSENASIGLLWDDLGISNGLASEDEFIARVKKYRKSEFVDRNTQVGFKILLDPVFLDQQDWFELPSDWSDNIVTGKAYSSSSDHGRYLTAKFSQLLGKLRNTNTSSHDVPGFGEGPEAGFTFAHNTKQRLGQKHFRLAILDAYSGKCAVTGSDVLETLDAAHLMDFSKNPNHSINNGILLRQDVHRLFDVGFIEITSDYRIKLTEKFKLSHAKSTHYQELDGRAISLPSNKKYWPDVELLQRRRLQNQNQLEAP